MRLFFLVLLLFVFQSENGAQVNIEDYRKTDKVRFPHAIELSWAVQKGATLAQTYVFNYRLDYFWGDYHAMAITQWERSVRDEITFQELGLMHLRGRMPLRSGLSWEQFVQKQWNDTLFLRDRVLVGTGLRVEENKNFVLGLGIMYEYEDYTTQAYTSRIRLTNYLTLSMPIEKAILTSTAYYQPAMDQLEDYRLLSRTSFKIFISETLYANIYYNLDFKSIAPVSLNALEYKSGMNIGLEF